MVRVPSSCMSAMHMHTLTHARKQPCTAGPTSQTHIVRPAAIVAAVCMRLPQQLHCPQRPVVASMCRVLELLQPSMHMTTLRHSLHRKPSYLSRKQAKSACDTLQATFWTGQTPAHLRVWRSSVVAGTATGTGICLGGHSCKRRAVSHDWDGLNL